MGGTDAITIIYLPEGPTAYFKLTSIELSKKIHVSKLRLMLGICTHVPVCVFCRAMHGRQSISPSWF